MALSVLFLFTALLGVWAAYDRAAAWRAFVLIVAGQAALAAIVWLGRRGGKQALGWLSVAVALLAGALGLYFLLEYDWTAGGAKFDLVQRAGLWMQAYRPALTLPEDINANVAAGGLIITLFLGLGGLLWAARERRWALLVLAGLPWLAGLLALLLTSSRGAWLGMGAGLLAMAYLLLRRRWIERPGRRWLLDLLALAAVLALAAAFWATLRWPEAVQALGSVPAAGGSALGRARLWQDGLGLVADYPFTGSGLRSTMMVHSSYSLLIHVGFITHMHNLLLQVAIEQGVIGSAALLGLLAVAAASVLSATRPGRRKWRFGLTAGAALAAMSVHGLVDAAVYGSLLLPLLFLPIGFALAADQPNRPAEAPGRQRPAWLLGLALAAVAVLALITLLPGSRAALQANLGAAAQTRGELALYQWPTWPLQDELRRTGAVDLAPAIARYQAALAENPANAAANRRLGQIELSLGRYEAARQHLEAAYAAAPANRAARQMLAESYAIAGDLERAAALLAAIDTSQGQMDARNWWYNHIGEPEHAELIRQAAEMAGMSQRMAASE